MYDGIDQFFCGGGGGVVGGWCEKGNGGGVCLCQGVSELIGIPGKTFNSTKPLGFESVFVVVVVVFVVVSVFG